MNFKQFLIERRGEWNPNDVVVVDIQPLYCKADRHKQSPFPISRFANFILQMLQKGRRVLYYFNGPDTIGSDSKEEICEWLVMSLFEDGYGGEEGGEDEYYGQLDQVHSQFLRNIIWYDKGYAFFRSWMDEGVSDQAIIQTIRYMVMHRKWDSRNLTPEEIEEITRGESVPENDPLTIPSIPINVLRTFNTAFLCGGSRHECLKEVQLLMNAFNIKYTIISQFIF